MVVDRAEEHRLAQIRRRLRTERVGQPARREAVVAALFGRTGRMPAVLHLHRQIEERKKLALRARQQLLRKTVARDDEKAGLFARARHFRRRVAPADVDGRYAAHACDSSASTTRSYGGSVWIRPPDTSAAFRRRYGAGGSSGRGDHRPLARYAPTMRARA